MLDQRLDITKVQFVAGKKVTYRFTSLSELVEARKELPAHNRSFFLKLIRAGLIESAVRFFVRVHKGTLYER
jgi:hypothetical protein